MVGTVVTPEQQIHERLLGVRAALARLLVAHPESSATVAEMLAGLTEVERLLGAAFSRDEPSSSDAAGRIGRRSRTRANLKRYAVERVAGHEYLAEYRADNPRPFRARRNLYDAVVAALAGAREPLRAGQIEELVERRLRDQPRNYLVHMCLRFLTAPEVRLVERVNARYSATNARDLARAARAAWTAARRRGVAPDGALDRPGPGAQRRWQQAQNHA